MGAFTSFCRRPASDRQTAEMEKEMEEPPRLAAGGVFQILLQQEEMP